MNWLRYWRGRLRLSHGYCPLCNSSPPKEDCVVCRGSRDYGPHQTSNERACWDYRFENWRWAARR